jgi:hypothetical protein
VGVGKATPRYRIYQKQRKERKKDLKNNVNEMMVAWFLDFNINETFQNRKKKDLKIIAQKKNKKKKKKTIDGFQISIKTQPWKNTKANGEELFRLWKCPKFWIV